MSVAFLGQYLITRGLITREQLDEALTEQRRRNVRLGELGVQKGMLTPEQAQRIHDMQRETDKPFGQMAVEQGYLTAQQLDELLSVQSSAYVYLGEALTGQGAVQPDCFMSAMNDFNRLQQDLQSRCVNLLWSVEEGGNLMRAVEAMQRAFIRFVGTPVKMQETCSELGLRHKESIYGVTVVLEDGLAICCGPVMGEEFLQHTIEYYACRTGVEIEPAPCCRDLAMVTGRYLRSALDGCRRSTASVKLAEKDELDELLKGVQVRLQAPYGDFRLAYRESGMLSRANNETTEDDADTGERA